MKHTGEQHGGERPNKAEGMRRIVLIREIWLRSSG
jgi:hypothetical protein